MAYGIHIVSSQGVIVFKATTVLGVFAALLAASVLASPGVASAVNSLEFKTPSGNIFCHANDGEYASVRCDIGEFSYTPPQPTEHCGVIFGHTVGLRPGERPQFDCAHDSMAYDQGVPVLGYGASMSVGSFTCDSTEQGVHCVDHDSGHSFLLSRDSYQFN